MPDIKTKQFIDQYRALYKTLDPIYCPALQTIIHFNSRGFNHLIFKGNKKRTDAIIRERLSLLPLATSVLQTSCEITEIRTRIETNQHKTVQATYYALEASADNKTRIRVIIRQIGAKGSCHFFSIFKLN